MESSTELAMALGSTEGALGSTDQRPGGPVQAATRGRELRRMSLICEATRAQEVRGRWCFAGCGVPAQISKAARVFPHTASVSDSGRVCHAVTHGKRSRKLNRARRCPHSRYRRLARSPRPRRLCRFGCQASQQCERPRQFVGGGTDRRLGIGKVKHAEHDPISTRLS